MRKFSVTEREVINYIVSREKIEQMCFGTLFLELMPTLAIKKTDKGIRMYCKTSDGKAVDLVQPYTKKLLDILFLIKYLEDNALIGVYRLAGEEEKILFSNKYNNEGEEFYEEKENGGNYHIKTNHIDYYAELSELLFHYFHSCFHASETLRELVKNNFKDEDTIRYEKNMASTKKSIGISFMIGLASIIIGTVGIWLNWKSLNQPSAYPIEHLKEIKTEIQNISTTIENQAPLIINSLPKKDTSSANHSRMVKKIIPKQ